MSIRHQEMQQHLSAWSVSGRCRDGNALRVEEVLLGPAKACGEKRQKSVVVFKVWVAKMDATPTRLVVLWGCEPLTNQFAGI